MVSIADRLKKSLLNAAKVQHDFVEVFEESMPVLEQAQIKLAQAVVGTEEIADIIDESVKALKLLVETMNNATMQQGAALFRIKEYEGDPSLVYESMIDEGTVMVNLGIWLSQHGPTIAEVLERADEKILPEAASLLPVEAQDRWIKALAKARRDRAEKREKA